MKITKKKIISITAIVGILCMIVKMSKEKEKVEIGTVFNLNIIGRKLKCYRILDEVQNEKHKVMICDFVKHGDTFDPYHEENNSRKNNQEEK